MGWKGLFVSKYGGVNRPLGVFCGTGGIPGVEFGVSTIPDMVGTRAPGICMVVDFLRWGGARGGVRGVTAACGSPVLVSRVIVTVKPVSFACLQQHQIMLQHLFINSL